MNATPDKPASWAALVGELDEWRRRGLKASFWARDDDAIVRSPKLDRLIATAKAAQIEIALAVIPARLSEPLSAYLRSGEAPFYPMCHGWRHVNYATPLRPSEFGPDRPLAILVDEAKSAYEVFSHHFRALPAIFVPPFARISPPLIAELPKIGFRGVSIGPAVAERRGARLASYLGLRLPLWPVASARATHCDVHIDLFDWRRGGARSRHSIAREALGCLRARRYGYVPSASPIGVLLHHLVFDEETWRVCHELFEIVANHPAVTWPSVKTIIENGATISSGDLRDGAAVTKESPIPTPDRLMGEVDGARRQ